MVEMEEAESPCWRRRAYSAYHVFALVATSIFILQQLVYAYQERGDMEKLSRVMFIMLCHATCVAKQLVFHVDAQRIDALVAGLAEPLFNPVSVWAQCLLRETARAARWLVLVYAGCAVATCVLWVVFPVLDHAQGGPVQFPFWAPVDCTATPKFLALLLYSFYMTSLVGVGNTTMDAFIVTVLSQCKTQLTILRINLETLVNRARAASGGKRQRQRRDHLAYELLVESIVHYQKITETCALLQDIFGEALLLQFAIGGWILCTAAYQIVSLDVMSIEFASMNMFIVCILTELFLYCYYGDEVKMESDRVLQSMYALEWLHVPMRVRRVLLVAMERAQRPLRPAAARVLPLTPDVYVKILKSSYSFYAVLRQTKSLARSSVRTHVRLLRWCGYCRLDGGAAWERLHRVYRAFTLALTVAYLLQECVYAYQERHDMDKLARVMFLLLCHITSIAKQLVFYLDADRVERLMAGLDDPLFNVQAGNARHLLMATATWATRFVRLYSGCAVVTCTLWIIFPVIYHLRGQLVEFPFWIGLDYSRPYRFAAVLLYSYYVTTLVGIANTTMDAFMATVLIQCKTQLRILRLNFESLLERAAAMEVARTGWRQDSLDTTLKALLLQCLAHYKHIVDTVALLERIFGTAILIQFTIGGWILCMAAYKIVSLSVLSIEFASMVLFTSCILTELFLYCYYGNEVTVESNCVVESIYSMEWVQTRVQFKRALLIVMERAKRPLRPAAGLFIPLSLDTFIKIIKSSYTFYAVLRQTK